MVLREIADTYNPINSLYLTKGQFLFRDAITNAGVSWPPAPKLTRAIEDSWHRPERALKGDLTRWSFEAP